MRVNFKKELSQAAELYDPVNPPRLRSARLTDFVAEKFGRQRFLVAYPNHIGSVRFFTEPDEIQAFDELFGNLVAMVSRITIGPHDPTGFPATNIRLAAHAAEIARASQQRPDDHWVCSAVVRARLGLGRYRFTLTEDHPKAGKKATWYARELPRPPVTQLTPFFG